MVASRLGVVVCCVGYIEVVRVIESWQGVVVCCVGSSEVYCRKEVGIMIGSWFGVVVCCVGSGEGEVEGASWILWMDGAADGEAGTLHHLQPLLLALRNPVHGGEDGDVWLKQQICNNIRGDLDYSKRKFRFKLSYIGILEIPYFTK